MDLQWLAIIPILSLLMLVHELGHFITARRAGIVVQEFGFGLPPRIYGYEHNNVIYSLNWIPFGAFVKMLGDEAPTESAAEPGRHWREDPATHPADRARAARIVLPGVQTGGERDRVHPGGAGDGLPGLGAGRDAQTDRPARHGPGDLAGGRGD